MGMGTPASLDLLDRQIIYWLNQNSRIGMPALAHKVHASVARVRYRIAQLVAAGHILSFIAIIDYRLLGWRVYTLYYRLREMREDRLKKLIARLERDFRVADIFLTEGTFDLQVAFLALHMDEAAEVMGRLREPLEPHIIEERLAVHLRSYFYTMESIMTQTPDERARPQYVLDIHDRPLELDDSDQKLLGAIANHADWPIWRIAKAVHLSGPTTYARIKRLERQKVILGYSVLVSPNLPGLSRYRIFMRMRHVTEKRQNELVRFLQQLPHVFRATFTFGDFGMYYDLMASDSDERRAVMHQVYERFGAEIIRQDWVRVNRIVKFSYYLSQKK